MSSDNMAPPTSSRPEQQTEEWYSLPPPHPPPTYDLPALPPPRSSRKPPSTPPRSPRRQRRMPSISEDQDNVVTEESSEQAAAEAGMTSLPLRIPAKSAKRASQLPPIQVGTPPPYHGFERTVSIHGPNGPQPSPSTGRRMSSIERIRQAAKEGYIPENTSSEDDGKEPHLLTKIGLDNSHWSSDRKRTCRFLGFVAAIALVIVGLAVGLGVGLSSGGSSKHKSDGTTSSGDSGSGSDSDSSAPNFPAGAYAFNTTLRQQKTDCTSNPATWRCYPYETGQPASFYWTITPDSDHRDTYAVSSSSNPFAPSFSNVSTQLTDPSTPDERLVFSINLNVTVIPDGAISANNLAANCTYEDAKFQATLWTRRHNGAAVSAPEKGETKYGDWPGDVEVKQMFDSTPGEPRCQDAAGNLLATVQAGSGSCLCQYASFPT